VAIASFAFPNNPHMYVIFFSVQGVNILLTVTYAIKRFFKLGPRTVNMLQALRHLNLALPSVHSQSNFSRPCISQAVAVYCDIKYAEK